MDGLLLFAAFILTVSGAVLFYRRSRRGEQKPRILAWYGWAIVNAVAAIAMYSDGHYPAAMLASLFTLTGIAVGFWRARGVGTQFRQIDAFAQLWVMAAIVLWVFFNSPIIAVTAVILIDIVTTAPVIRHYFTRPAKKLLVAYVCWTLAAAFVALASDAWSVTAVAFPLYAAAINLITVTVLLLSKASSEDDQDFANVEEL